MSQAALQATPPASVPDPESFWTKIPGVATAICRGYPRVHANVPVRITGLSDGSLDVRTNDLSLGGLQIGCDRATALKLRPDADGEERNPVFIVTLLLDVDGLALRVNAHARVLHMSTVPHSEANREVAVGLKFLGFEEGGKHAVMRFIEYHMCPAGV